MEHADHQRVTNDSLQRSCWTANIFSYIRLITTVTMQDTRKKERHELNRLCQSGSIVTTATRCALSGRQYATLRGKCSSPKNFGGHKAPTINTRVETRETNALPDVVTRLVTICYRTLCEVLLFLHSLHVAQNKKQSSHCFWFHSCLTTSALSLDYACPCGVSVDQNIQSHYMWPGAMATQ